jgi:hypothetical protein
MHSTANQSEKKKTKQRQQQRIKQKRKEELRGSEVRSLRDNNNEGKKGYLAKKLCTEQ